MPEERVSPWLKISTFLGKGPRYIGTYFAWRARRAWKRRLLRAPSWPPVKDLPPTLSPANTSARHVPGPGRFGPIPVAGGPPAC